MLTTENVTATADCGRKVDIERLARHSGALMDFEFHAVKFSFNIPSPAGEKQAVVSVYSTGKVVCLGANTVSRAVSFTGKVLAMLGCGGAEVGVSRVMMNGSLDAGPGADAYSRVGELKKEFRVGVDTEVMGGVMVLNAGGVRVQLTPREGGTNVVAGGPDEDKVRRAVARISEIVSGSPGRHGGWK